MKSVGKGADGEHEEYNHKEHSEERRNTNNKTESRQVPKKKKSHDKDRPLKRLDKSWIFDIYINVKTLKIDHLN